MNIGENIVYDLNDNPLYQYNEDKNNLDSIVYYKLNGRKLLVGLDVKYKDGDDSLKNYILKNYYNYPECRPEININLYYYILFDRKLHIKEIRYSKIGISDDLKRVLLNMEYLSIIEEILLKSENNWEVKKKYKKKYRLFLGSVKID